MHAPSETDPTPFGEVLRHFRLTAGLTQEELAEQAGVSRLTISSLERGVRRVPHKDTLRRLADSLQLPARDRVRLEAAGRNKSPEGPAGAEGTITSVRCATSPPLVGRGKHLDILERHVERAGPPLVTLAGEPGIGKTRLLQELAAYAALYGLRVLQGGCQRRRIQEQYSPVSVALAQHLSIQTSEQRQGVVRSFPWMAHLLPELAADLAEELPSVPPDQEFRLMAQALADYLMAPGSDSSTNALGTLLILDDLQWAGTDALDLLSAMVRRVNGFPGNRVALRIVGAYRDSEVNPEDPLSITLSDLVPGRLATQLSLGPLPEEESRQLVETLLVGHPDKDLDVTLRLAGGVPFFLIEYAQAIRAGVDGVPLDVTQSIRSRVTALTNESREILKVAAVVGRTVPHDLLMAVTGQEEDVFTRALEAVQRAKLLVPAGENLCRFPYDVIRDVAAADLGSALPAPLRRRIEAARRTEVT
jgi:transcriptional regulator with XRE-family HTH domain